MSDEKTSPGPWRWDQRSEKDDDMPALVDARGGTVCDFGNATQYYPTAGEPPSDADARLIAAAPEMLALLREIVAVDFGGWQEHQATALLARIDGKVPR